MDSLVVIVAFRCLKTAINISELIISTIRGRLHGEFQPGLKFRSSNRAEILLQLHGEF